MFGAIKKWLNEKLKSKTPFDDLRLVTSTTEEYLASIYTLKLEEEGIPVFTINKKDSSYNSFGTIELYVHHTFVIKAKHIIKKEHE